MSHTIPDPPGIRYKTAFRCVMCGGEVYAQNAMALRLLEAGKTAWCAKCLNGEVDYAAMPYTEYLKTQRWKDKAQECKESAGRRCRLCNSSGPLEAHHRTYERRGYELPDDLTALCEPCHALYTAYEKGLISIPEDFDMTEVERG